MTTLSNAELESMRACIEDLLPDLCDIQAVTRTSNGQGGWTETWAATYEDVKCRIDPLRGSELPEGGAVQENHMFVATLPSDTTITTANRIVSGSYTYNVVSVDPGKSWIASVRAYVELV